MKHGVSPETRQKVLDLRRRHSFREVAGCTGLPLGSVNTHLIAYVVGKVSKPLHHNRPDYRFYTPTNLSILHISNRCIFC